MWLFKLLKSYLGWAFSICRKIVRTAPLFIFVVVVATLVSQLARVLAYLLPLKIIILIGSSRVPRYFPSAFADIERETLVVWLGAATVGFYLLHLLSDRVTAVYAERTASRVIERAGKLVLFPNQEEIARGACRKLARSIAAAIFTVAALLLLSFIHFSAFVVLLAGGVIAFLLTALLGMLSKPFRAWLEHNTATFISVVAALGFFAVTASIVLEFLSGASFNVLYAVVSLLLSRQLLQRLSASATDSLTLNAQRLPINALFLHGHALVARPTDHRKDVWSLVDQVHLREWLPDALFEITGRKLTGVRMTRWYQTGITDVVAFEAEAVNEEGVRKGYFVKLFGPRRRMLATNEATLLAATKSGGLPAFDFIGASQIDDNNCHIFECATRRKTLSWTRSAKYKVLGACWLWEPPEELVQRYCRSHHLLGQRLSSAMTERLIKVAIEPEEQHLVREFGRVQGNIRSIVERLPLAICNPDLNADTMFKVENNQLIATHWGRWSLEPVGAGWPITDKALSSLAKWLTKVKNNRPALANVTADQMRVAALLFAFESLYIRQSYRSAIALLPALLKSVQEVKTVKAGKATQKTLAIESLP